MTKPTIVQLATRLMPWIGMDPLQLPPESVLVEVEAEVRANRDDPPDDDATAITLDMAIRSMLELRRTIDATGQLPDAEDQKLVGICMEMFVSALIASGELG